MMQIYHVYDESRDNGFNRAENFCKHELFHGLHQIKESYEETEGIVHRILARQLRVPPTEVNTLNHRHLILVESTSVKLESLHKSRYSSIFVKMVKMKCKYASESST